MSRFLDFVLKYTARVTISPQVKKKKKKALQIPPLGASLKVEDLKEFATGVEIEQL